MAAWMLGINKHKQKSKTKNNKQTKNNYTAVGEAKKENYITDWRKSGGETVILDF